jgi:N-acylglucosamine 2-epimerase
LERRLFDEVIPFRGRVGSDPYGRAVVPGHVVEDVWFQIQVAKSLGKTKLIAPAIHLLRRHLEFGWDDEFGGIILARDADGGGTEGWGYPDLKLWWPHTEALVSCLVAFDETGEQWSWDWYKKVLEYSFDTFYMPEVGEWRQRLTRDHKPFTATVALPVKDPFHLPRPYTG